MARKNEVREDQQDPQDQEQQQDQQDQSGQLQREGDSTFVERQEEVQQEIDQQQQDVAEKGTALPDGRRGAYDPRNPDDPATQQRNQDPDQRTAGTAHPGGPRDPRNPSDEDPDEDPDQDDDGQDDAGRPEAETPELNARATKRAELDGLKLRANSLGVQYHPSIGAGKLREKIELYLARNPQRDPDRQPVPTPTAAPNASSIAGTGPENAVDAKAERSEERLEQRRNAPRLGDTADGQKRDKLLNQRQEAARLVRIRLTNMNPMKKDWQGEIITVSNSVVGTFRKYVPFNAEEGWHVPNIIFQALKARQCQIFVNARDDRGNAVKRSKQVPEFAIEELDPLTPAELQELAQRQAMAGSTANA